MDAGEVRTNGGGGSGLRVTVASGGAVVAGRDYNLNAGKIETKIDVFGRRGRSIAVAVAVDHHARRDFGLNAREVRTGVVGRNFELYRSIVGCGGGGAGEKQK